MFKPDFNKSVFIDKLIKKSAGFVYAGISI
jgi:hypothetical protein